MSRYRIPLSAALLLLPLLFLLPADARAIRAPMARRNELSPVAVVDIGSNSVRLVVYVTDMFRFRPIVNKIQSELWGQGPYPPRTIIEVHRLNQDDIVEVEGTFYAPPKNPAGRADAGAPVRAGSR